MFVMIKHKVQRSVTFNITAMVHVPLRKYLHIGTGGGSSYKKHNISNSFCDLLI